MSTDRSGASLALLDFEQPLALLEERLGHLRARRPQTVELNEQVVALERELEQLHRETFAHLSRWQVVQLARHPRRPTCLDYIERLFPDFMELQGDRLTGEDPSLVGGPATLDGRTVMIIAHGRGRTPEERQLRGDGPTRPAGFRKATRLVQLADRLDIPVISLIDTPGAQPGPDAEEHGQAWAIAGAIDAYAQLSVPTVACVVGEGGSGGALALSVADRLLMQQYGIFPVISPEACSSILYRDGTHAPQMAEALRPTAEDLHALDLVDEIVAEPRGGAHRDHAEAARLLAKALSRSLDALRAVGREERLAARYRRLRAGGAAPSRSETRPGV